jgi:hypothetical protein
MSIRSYELSGDDVKSLIVALDGNEEGRVKWLEKLRGYDKYRDRQIRILDLIEGWLKAFGLRTGVHIGRKDWETDEENLMDWVWYQMEYVGGICWDKQTQKVAINKYASSRPLLNEEHTKELLEYLNENL